MSLTIEAIDGTNRSFLAGVASDCDVSRPLSSSSIHAGRTVSARLEVAVNSSMLNGGLEAAQLKVVVSPLPKPEGCGELLGGDKLQRLSQRRRLRDAEGFLKTVLSAFPGGRCFFKLPPAGRGQGDQTIAAIFWIGTNYD
jgi:hypothetical protein